MFKVVPFEEIHAEPLIREEINKDTPREFFEGHLTELKQNTMSYTFMVGDDIVAVGGIAKLWEGRGYIWLIFSEKLKKHPVAAYRGMKAFLKKQPYRRLELDTPTNRRFDDRRARFMGFKLECPFAKSYYPNGEDRALYSWVRE